MFLIFCCWALGMILGMIFDRFLVDFGIENRWKIDEKSIEKQIKNKMRFGIDFWRLLDGFWGGFGGQVGAKLEPSWGQVGMEIDKKRCQKKNEKKIASWRHLGANLAPSWPPKTSQNGAKLGAKSIQVWCWFENGFWKDFGIIFNWILYTT